MELWALGEFRYLDEKDAGDEGRRRVGVEWTRLIMGFTG